MNRVTKICALAVLFLAAGSAQADLSFTDHTVVNTDIKVWWLIHETESIEWFHDNPYPGDYDAALAAGLITGTTLTINASDIQSYDDTVKVFFWDWQGNQHYLGRLYSGDNTYTLNPAWLDTIKVRGTLYYIDDTPNDWSDDAAINYSDLTVTAVPVPGAVLLGLLGLSVAGIKLRKHA